MPYVAVVPSYVKSVTFDCHDPLAVAAFWASALGSNVDEDSTPERAWVEPPGWGGPSLWFQRVPESKVAKNRQHFDLRATGPLEDERDRLVGLGAHEVRRDGDLFVMARPRGQRVLPGDVSAPCRSPAPHWRHGLRRPPHPSRRRSSTPTTGTHSPPSCTPTSRCRLVHTGEVFDRDRWVRLNADYPGFQRLVVEDLVAVGDRAVLRARVTGTGAGGQEQVFAVASFATVRDDLVVELAEVWADVDQEAPEGTRPLA